MDERGRGSGVAAAAATKEPAVDLVLRHVCFDAHVSRPHQSCCFVLFFFLGWFDY
jgi:hypothetical protein